jgi:cytochrome P450
MSLAQRFPLGHGITLSELDKDPYPVYRQLQCREPISWCPATGMYLVTRYEDVRTVLMDTESYVAGTENSLIMDTFGAHMLTTEGELHDVYKQPLLPLFRAAAVRDRLQKSIEFHVTGLIDGFRHQGEADLRSAFAGRLPILSMLSLFGLPAADEGRMRGWYDAFEQALANFTWDAGIRNQAKLRVSEFHRYLQNRIKAKRLAPDESLLSQMIASKDPRPLSDEEIRRNASIIFFGGISTVEALILNSLYVLTDREVLMDRLQRLPDDTRPFLDEVVRWSGPVQSATRHVARPTELGGVEFSAGDTVNCMLAAANRDLAVFPQPDAFDMDRPNLRNHMGFAIGSHHCLGSHLAKLEAALAIEGLLNALPGLRRKPGNNPTMTGYEFRQPKQLVLVWETAT